jgi:beta-xylosidase
MPYFSLSGWIRLATAFLTIGVVVLLVAGTAVTQIQPIIPRDFPDPAVLAVSGGYYAYSTASVYGHQFWHVPEQHSDGLDSDGGWQPVRDALPALPGWVAREPNGDANVTAPEVSPRPGGGYLLYFVARSASLNAQCIGAALSRTPGGPFQPEPAPLVCQPGGSGAPVDSIDPQAFTDRDGQRYLLYASGAHRTTIWLQRTTPDGLALSGGRRGLITADRPDEANIVEAPALITQGTEYVLFYSGDTFNSGQYFVNYATAASLGGPFRKNDGQFVNRDTLGGSYPNPGGQSVLVSHGDDQLVFHASTGPGRRAMFVAELTWGPAGRPVVDVRHGLTHRYATLF